MSFVVNTVVIIDNECTQTKIQKDFCQNAKYVNSLLVLQNFTTVRKSGNILLTYLKAIFVRYSSEYETSDSDRKGYPKYISRCGYM